MTKQKKLVFDPTRAANAVPERLALQHAWEHGLCKRCLANGTKSGDVIVRIYGKGWWHDRCYRVVDPAFYEGLESAESVAAQEPRESLENVPF